MDIEQSVEAARATTRQLMARANRLLSSGADARRVHSYVVRALELLADVEAYAILASAGDRDATTTVERLVTELAALQKALKDEDFA